MHALINPTKAFRTLRKTPHVLSHIVAPLSQEHAITWRDGAAGWSILYILCHLRDMEALYIGRVEDILSQPNPTFRTLSNDELIRQNNYSDEQPFQTVLAEFMHRRNQLIALLEGTVENQWLRTGIHPQQGPATLLDVAINCGLHDVDHIEQIVSCLRS